MSLSYETTPLHAAVTYKHETVYYRYVTIVLSYYRVGLIRAVNTYVVSYFAGHTRGERNAVYHTWPHMYGIPYVDSSRCPRRASKLHLALIAIVPIY